MAKFRIDYYLSGNIVIEAETKEDALLAYYDMRRQDIIGQSESTLREEVDSVEKV